MNTYQHNREPPWLLLLCFILAYILVIEARCATVNYSPEQIERLILWSVRNESSVRVQDDPEFLQEVAVAYLVSAETYSLPVLYLVAIGYRESKYRMDQVGDNGKSLGMGQVGILGRQYCADVCGDLSTAQQNTDCSACWLGKGRDWCGSFNRGLCAYSTGKCRANTIGRKRIVNIRHELVAKYMEILEGYKEGE